MKFATITILFVLGCAVSASAHDTAGAPNPPMDPSVSATCPTTDKCRTWQERSLVKKKVMVETEVDVEETIVHKEVERIVYVDRPVEVIKEVKVCVPVPVEKKVYVYVDRPVHVFPQPQPRLPLSSGCCIPGFGSASPPMRTRQLTITGPKASAQIGGGVFAGIKFSLPIFNYQSETWRGPHRPAHAGVGDPLYQP
jgi:hypothetical protein